MMNLVRKAFSVKCSTMSEKLVLVYAVATAENGRNRLVPAEVASTLGISQERVEAAFATLTTRGFIDATRWNDSGAWSMRITLGDKP